jgi:signal transduction histidine kinase
MRLKKTNEKTIIFYYIIAIVIPCLLLGVLAFRGIKNDQALVEREQRRVLMETTEKIYQELDDSLATIENSFSELNIQNISQKKEIFNNDTLVKFMNQHDVVEAIFSLENKTSLALCDNGLLFSPDGSFPENNINSTPENLRNVWQYEFMEKDYIRAFRLYNALLKNANDDNIRGKMLNAMARVQKKRGDIPSALSLYDSIQNNYSWIYLQNNIPLGVVSFIEKTGCYLQINDTVSALENTVKFLEMLAGRYWDLEQSYFNDYVEKADETIIICRKSKSSIFNSTNEYALTFLSGYESIVENVYSAKNTNNHRYKQAIDGKQYFYTILSGKENTDWVILFNTIKILEKFIVPALSEYASSVLFYWMITDNEGEFLAGSDNNLDGLFFVTSDFPSGQPPWSLQLFTEEKGLFNTFFRSGGGFFFYIFIVVLVILGFGLIFTLQTVNNKIELSKMKSSFVSTVSHELKSPLTSIRQIAEILVFKKVSAERTEKYFTMILQQSERLSHLIENILDFSKIEAGQKQFRFEETDLAAITSDVIKTFQDRLTSTNFHIHYTCPKTVYKIQGDREALEQVLYNLIDNAVKYSGNSKIIEISLKSDYEWVELCVRDYGIGIPKDEHEKIFQQFHRVGQELTGTIKGTGIGLTIVKQIIDVHKGKIEVKSTSGEGSLFCIKLPVSKLH